MNAEEAKTAVFAALREIAPEADASVIEPDVEFREQLDIDSMDFLNLIIGIHERTVKLHRTSITAKLGVRSVAELTRLTQEAGFEADAAPASPG